MEKTEFKSNENELSSNVIAKPENLIFKEEYKILDSNIKSIRKSKFTKYKKWVNARKSIDDFYNEHTYKLDLLYDRYINLENKLSIFHNVTNPTIITVIFGIYISFVIIISQYVYSVFHESLSTFDSIIEDALLKVSQIEIDKQPFILEQIETLKQMKSDLIFELLPYLIGITILIILGLVILFLNQKFMYKADKLKLDLYSYEVDKLKNLIDVKEEEERKKSSELENQETPN